MILHLSPNTGGVVELHIHEGACVTFEAAKLDASSAPAGDEPKSKSNKGLSLSSVVLPVAAGLVGIVVGVALMSQSTVARVPVAPVAALQFDPAPRAYATQVPTPALRQGSVIPYVPGPIPQTPSRSDDSGPTALPPAIAQQLAQPAQVAPSLRPSAAPQKQAGSVFGLED